MPLKLKHWVISNIYILLLVLVNLGLFIANIHPNKHLSGWDNLQMELSPVLNVKRAIFSVWEEYQSFGLLAGLAHAADLPHTVFILFLSFILPNWLVRYVFHCVMLLVGSLGMFFFLNKLIFKGEKQQFSFLGAIFYLLNFGTIQIFYIPLEAFSTFFAFLPWLVLSFISLLEEGLSPKRLLGFALLNLLATPMSHVQTVFLVYLLTLGTITLSYLITNRKQLKKILGISLVGFFTILSMNMFWLLPQLYFASGFRSVVDNAKINQLATDNVYQQNQGAASLNSLITFQGFYYDQTDASRKLLFQPWQNYFHIDILNLLPYLFFIIIILGCFHKKQRLYISFIGLFFLCAVALLSTIPPFNFINGLLRSSGFISQVFRSPFTKFITLYTFVASYFFALGVDQFVGYLKKPVYAKATAFILGVAIIIYSLPAFQGAFFSPKMHVQIPDRYFQLMEYFKTQDKNKRIALLPDSTFWGWFNYSWGYYGSGFLWYGIEQPIVSRTFDVWSKESEGYFWELKQAFQSDTPTQLEAVLDKYNVDYLVFDETVLPLNAATSSKEYAKVEKMLAKSTQLTPVQKWDKLFVYQRKNLSSVTSFVSRRNELPNVGPGYFVTNSDRAYVERSIYKTDATKPYDFFYPFIDFMTQTRFPQKTWEIEESPTNYTVSREIPFDTANYDLSVATDSAPLATAPATLSGKRIANPVVPAFDTRIQKVQAGFSAAMNDGWLALNVPKINLTNFDVRSTTIDSCGQDKKEIQATTTDSSLSVKAFNSSTACFSYAAEYLPQPYGYIMTVENKNWLGQPLFFYVLDGTKEESYIEDRLRNPTDYFILKSNPNIPPEFSIHFQANSYGPISSTNDLYTVRMDVFPVDIINSIFFKKKGTTIPLGEDLPYVAQKQSYYKYTVDITSQTDVPSSVILYQSFHPGWVAYGPDGKELKSHYRVNNWANGWDIPAGTKGTITLLFWPQYLEYIGFGIGVIAIGILWYFVWKKGRSHTPLPHHIKHS